MRSDEEFECMLAEKKKKKKMFGGPWDWDQISTCVCVAQHKIHLFHRSQKFLILRAKKGSKKEIPVYSEMCVGGGVDILWCFERCRREFPPPLPPLSLAFPTEFISVLSSNIFSTLYTLLLIS
ncbi:hypothetical protein DAPPUDRAFT_301037 [Daphnia pulex]|uniref:Uncharacterized protein n=1 Tax=Daphnia pulex TaxID=6669 RepID=E9HGH7_DAPPU|nr:hypothetical protein DAPPUDRAFT_301037 [Daphnia pulex]|eukprot:EFX69156.1 hypothetical protein DAPPUDRAFT_301037 [Daphnia pulex]